MLEIAWFATRLFLKGKLLRDPVNFIKQVVFGTVIGLLLFLSLAQVQIPLGITVIVSSLLTGILMPYLFKNFKMK
ncbi:hypothetical protein RIVM261_003360 [Rivularia sp. IAM M-261]|nr:hypothetical protein NIES2101_00055 [Calothrix sp. HK-06]BDA71442.1 hypothetical protein CAL7716_056080 [Calothrix sp. PCC 7716]GJD15380.1 hypothetical protein RIVM261_003360 [Rivularia sp. IAM M-261]